MGRFPLAFMSRRPVGHQKEQAMPCVQDVLTTKGSAVHAISASATVLEATILMNEQKIGALVVMEGERVAGIFSERDVLRRVVAKALPPAIVRIEQVMTSEVVCCHPETDLDEASRIMRDRRIRHLPVCDEDGRLLGIISIGDLNAYHASAQEAHIHFLHDYMFGRA
jgi:CBS domain-containing protein